LPNALAERAEESFLIRHALGCRLARADSPRAD
jgi:hypothetical protein